MATIEEVPTRRLTRVEVSGLLDAFEHEIDFPSEWEFVIVYGPNGAGKTKVLELIKATIGLNFAPLESIPFKQFRLDFSDGTQLVVDKQAGPSDDDSDSKIYLVLRGVGDDVVYDLSADPSAAAASWMMRSTRWLPFEGDRWIDPMDGEILPLRVLLDRHDVPLEIRRRAHGASEGEGIPTAIMEFCRTVPIHLIETQRLLALNVDGPDRYMHSARGGSYRPYGEQYPQWSRTVTQYSSHLKAQLAEALASNSRLGQQLDRTFPRRIMQTDAPAGVDDDSVRVKYERQSKLRSRLARFGLIEAEGDLPLPERALEGFEVKALSIYLDDTDRKLATFQSLLERLELFVTLINQRLARKTVSIDVNQGLHIRRHDTGETIGAEALSSGEQHELVLVYDLLFRTPFGSTVLIDEPEISLHVAWQQKFLGDISAIARLSDLRFIIATHSPQIIDKWWDRTAALDLE